MSAFGFAGCGSDEIVRIEGGDQMSGDDAGMGGNGSSGTGGTSGGGAGNTATGLGAVCEATGECETDLLCVEATSNDWTGGGPAGGYCTLACMADTDCAAFDQGSLCFNGFCAASCTAGVASAAKCGGRSDVACASFTDPAVAGSTIDVCLPTCGSDAECGASRFCDLRSGLCFDALFAGDPVGTPCDPAALTDPCAGFCADLGGGMALCSGNCVFGQIGCNADPADATPASAVGEPACVFSPAGAIGDFGICLSRCNCDDECQNDEGLCLASVDALTLQTAGFCVPPLTDAAGAPLPGLMCPANPDAGLDEDAGLSSDAGTDAGADGGP